ncbi:7-cyano-7-deazaguanine synthase QueC [Ferruginivarius sediminum]|uniref:7-cyano-7-deazaguanine synthase n=1 Tax=Ferruginivarius sediminum TaxID=2661937 RepID=A0A369TB44_9PROT|nr:7-cyano-7-deazaguanine synthase QueC [Ferruginivarius sediminum]RDD61724.1 7-cyano-7-deazaguanine synthase QueC [Ferruginivarius sediminum]
MKRTLVICSGGLDSVTLAHRIAAGDGGIAGLLTFDYGQRHRKEIDFARACAMRLDVPHEVVDMSDVGARLKSSALTGNKEVPEGHYAAETMQVTVVPNRNAIMLTIAFAIAAANGIERVAAAMHGGDHFIYPDCRPAFTQAFQDMQDRALEDVARVELHVPFIDWSKTDIAAEAGRLGVPVAETWSCYKGEARHCGRCGTCVERLEALHEAALPDPTEYEDTTYWRQAVSDR